jgi:predicted GTPase
MGPTGTGKSAVRNHIIRSQMIWRAEARTYQFIHLLTGDPKIRIVHTLESQAQAISKSDVRRNGRDVALVDTPGFDDSREGVTGADILRKIAEFLKKE